MYYKFELTEIPKVTNYYSVTRNTTWSISDKYNILILINEGMCEFSLDSEAFTAKVGDVVFIPANHSYCRRAVNGSMCTMTYIHFTVNPEFEHIEPKTILSDIIEQKNMIENDISFNIQPTILFNNVYVQTHNTGLSIDKCSEILADMKMSASKFNFNYLLHPNIALCRILIYITDGVLSNIENNIHFERENYMPETLIKALTYIRCNYANPISLDELAGHCNVSKQQLSRYFKDAFNDTTMNYIIKYKITKSQELLFNFPSLTVTDVAYESGFNDQHYFSRVFRKITGETPSQYKYRVHHFQQK